MAFIGDQETVNQISSLFQHFFLNILANFSNYVIWMTLYLLLEFIWPFGTFRSLWCMTDTTSVISVFHIFHFPLNESFFVHLFHFISISVFVEKKCLPLSDKSSSLCLQLLNPAFKFGLRNGFGLQSFIGFYFFFFSVSASGLCMYPQFTGWNHPIMSILGLLSQFAAFAHGMIDNLIYCLHIDYICIYYCCC